MFHHSTVRKLLDFIPPNHRDKAKEVIAISEMKEASKCINEEVSNLQSRIPDLSQDQIKAYRESNEKEAFNEIRDVIQNLFFGL